MSGHLIVYELGRNDLLEVRGDISAELDGGAGDDALTGHDVLHGDEANGIVRGASATITGRAQAKGLR